MKLNISRIRAYARTMDAGMRTIEEVQEEYRVSVYIELIATYDWNYRGLIIGLFFNE